MCLPVPEDRLREDDGSDPFPALPGPERIRLRGNQAWFGDAILPTALGEPQHLPEAPRPAPWLRRTHRRTARHHEAQELLWRERTRRRERERTRLRESTLRDRWGLDTPPQSIWEYINSLRWFSPVAEPLQDDRDDLDQLTVPLDGWGLYSPRNVSPHALPEREELSSSSFSLRTREARKQLTRSRIMLLVTLLLSSFFLLLLAAYASYKCHVSLADLKERKAELAALLREESGRRSRRFREIASIQSFGSVEEHSLWLNEASGGYAAQEFG